MSYSLRSLIGAALSASLIFSPVVNASSNSALWFEHTDIQMPTSTKVAQLNNGLRFVVLPTTRNSDEVSLRVRIGSGSAQQSLEHDASARLAAQSCVESSDWKASTELEQTVFSLDLAHADETSIETNLAAIRQGLVRQSSSNGFKSKFYVPQNTTVIITGGVNTRQTIKLIQRQFSDWVKTPVSLKAQGHGVDLDSYLQSESANDTSFAVRTLKTLADEQDSKLHRKEILLTTVANKLLEQRIQKALEQQQSQAKVTVDNEVLFDHRVLSQVRVTEMSADEKSDAEKLVETEIKRAIATGFTQVEYEMVVSQLREQLQRQTRQGSEHYAAEQADRLVAAISLGTVYTEPSYDLDLLNFHVAHLNEYDVSKEFEKTWSAEKSVFL
ncbi:insulinase family protein [Vibrio bivalvicida]|uniref:Peptidase M16 n=1 Tax=Vibrio bivalvicida TaxID=1276888 RepID=A0A177XVJ4_9VIBR|nr:insulinase family protein [Vibrio bivalvicida]OAJ92634.1 peptidase M16 [Vibrio bivalvicida]